MKKALPSLGRWLVNLFLVLALLLAAAVWLPEAFHMRAYVVKSSSMEPAIRVGRGDGDAQDCFGEPGRENGRNERRCK